MNDRGLYVGIADMGTAVLATCLLLMISGCTHTRVLPPDARAEINQRGQQSTATLKLNTGERITTRSLHFAPDVVSWVDPVTGRAASRTVTEIVSVQFTKRGRGALQGLGIGLVAGVLIGAVVFVIDEHNTDPCTEFCFFLDPSPGEAAVIGAVLVGVPSALLGAAIGGARGSREVFLVAPHPIEIRPRQ